MDWAQILVILLAVLFAIFLTIVVILAVLLVSITRQIKAATASAQRTMVALEDATNQFSRAALPLMITKKIINQVIKTSKKKERRQADE